MYGPKYGLIGSTEGSLLAFALPRLWGLPKLKEPAKTEGGTELTVKHY